jgi:hypothetical protein
MPAVPIIAGIASAAAGAGAFSLAAGFTLANVAAGMVIVGGISTALGAATGNKKLMKFGAVVGLGGVALGGIASLSGNASGGASGGLGLKAPAANGGMGLTAGSAGQGLSGSAVQGLSGSAVQGLSGSAGQGISSGLLGSATPSYAIAPSLSGVAEAGVQAATPGLSAATQAGVQSANKAFESAMQLGGGAGPAAITTGWDSAKGMLSNFGQTLNKNPGLITVGLGALSGMSQAKAAEEAAAEEQRIRAADRNRFNTSITSQRARF